MKKTFALFYIILAVSYHSAQASVQDSLLNTLKTSSKEHHAEIYVAIGNEYYYNSSDSVAFYARKALKLLNKYPNASAESEANFLLGRVEKNKGNFEEALTYLIKALKAAEASGNEEALTRIYNGIGIIYKKMKRYDEALPYYVKANQLAIKYENHKAAANTYNNIGTIYLANESWDTVEIYYDSALMYAEQTKDTRALSTILFNMADLYRAQKRYNKSLSTSLRCLRDDKTNEDKYGMFMSYFQIARVLEEMDRFEESYNYADSAEQVAVKEQLNRERIDLYAWYSNVFEAQNNYEKAFDYYRKSRTLRDTMLTETTARQISELQTRYETEKKEQRIVLQQSEIKQRNYIIAGITGLLVLGLLLGYSFYNRYKLKQQDKLQKAVIRQQELATQAVIEAEERERKRIAGDLHDGVGQTMSAAKMNLSTISSDIPFKDVAQKQAFDKAMALVDESCKEVRTVSHNIMPNALLKTGLATAIRDFLNKIDSKVLQVNLYTEGMQERLPNNVETVLYRVVQECVNNTIKHAAADMLDMTIIKDEDGVSITIEDNGKGFDIVQAKAKDGIGLQNIVTRIQYLKGSIEWDTAPGKGTVVMIQIPGAAIA